MLHLGCPLGDEIPLGQQALVLWVVMITIDNH